MKLIKILFLISQKKKMDTVNLVANIRYFSEIDPNKKYKVEKIKLVKSKFGGIVIIQLSKFGIFCLSNKIYKLLRNDKKRLQSLIDLSRLRLLDLKGFGKPHKNSLVFIENDFILPIFLNEKDEEIAEKNMGVDKHYDVINLKFCDTENDKRLDIQLSDGQSEKYTKFSFTSRVGNQFKESESIMELYSRKRLGLICDGSQLFYTESIVILKIYALEDVFEDKNTNDDDDYYFNEDSDGDEWAAYDYDNEIYSTQSNYDEKQEALLIEDDIETNPCNYKLKFFSIKLFVINNYFFS